MFRKSTTPNPFTTVDPLRPGAADPMIIGDMRKLADGDVGMFVWLVRHVNLVRAGMDLDPIMAYYEVDYAGCDSIETDGMTVIGSRWNRRKANREIALDYPIWSA